MSGISNKKKKFIKRNFKYLSVEELSRKTGLKPAVISSLIDHYPPEMPGKDQSAQVKKSAGIFLPWKTILVTSLFFSVISIIIYYPSLNGDFVFDDSVIQKNPLIHMTRISQLPDLLFSQEVGRKIGLMSFALNYYFGGFNTFGYHLVNVIIHILNGFALFLLAHTILTLPANEEKVRDNAFMIAFLGSLLWLVHPIQTQAVSYIVQRLTSLSALFFLLSLLCYIKGRMNTSSQKKVVLFVLCSVLGLLALGTKQNAATLPLFIIVSEFLFFQRYPLKLDKTKWAVFIFLLGLFILISWGYLGSDVITKLAQTYEKRGWTPLERVLTQLRVVVLYLSLLIYPHPSRLNLDYDFPVSNSLFSPFTTFLSLLVIAGLVTLAIFLLKRNRLASYALFWFLGNLVIESSIIPLELVFEHRAYLPSMGLMVVGIALCYRLPKRKWHKWVTALIIPLLLLFSYWTYERASVWLKPIALYMDILKKSPHKARPHIGIGRAYEKSGKLDDALSEYKKALSISPHYPKAHFNLGNVYRKKGMMGEAISEYKKALAIQPNYAKAHNNLSVTYFYKGNFKLAVAHCDRAIALRYNVKPKLLELLKPYR
jgi:tetratricopeptide (TPR) repeat protein